MKKFRKFGEQGKTREEPKNKAGVYFSLFIAGIMIFSVGAIFLSNPEEADYSFGKYEFKSKNGMWNTKIEGKQVSFYLLPEQVLGHNVSKTAISSIKSNYALIIAFNPNTNSTPKLQAIDLLRFEVVDALTKTNPSKQLGYAITEKSEKYDIPVVSCENASFAMPIMILDYSDKTGIDINNNCIKVFAADEYSMLAMNDYLKYSIYGVFDEK
ncbi:hypothetical protein JXB27_02125 [Candidatus Woesearchaeota archaeon]|nr:hypothetical protein [Candidatus Woesearchaeota archaeon]